MNINIEGVRLSKNGQQYAVCCVNDGFRYHYWSEDHATLTPLNDILYKSPLLGMSSHEKDWFQPRKLKVSKNKLLVEAMRKNALANNLLVEAIEADAKAEARRLEDQRLRSREHMVQEIRAFATWDLKLPIDRASDNEVFAALRELVQKIHDQQA